MLPQANAKLQTPPAPVKSASTAKLSGRREVAPLTLLPKHPNADYSAANDATPVYAEPADQDVVGLSVPGPGSSQRIMLLPKSLKVRNEPPSEDYFIRNVSH